MTEMTRRTLIAAGAAATAAAATADGTTTAAAQSYGSQGDTAAAGTGPMLPGTFRYDVGDITLFAVHDGAFERPLEDGFVPNAGIEAMQEAQRAAFLSPDTVHIPFTPTVMRHGDRVVLLDAGTGGKFGPTTGFMTANMAAAGIRAEDVTDIIISHFHPDHILGLTTAENAGPVFPNALVHVPEAEWAFWMDEGEMSRASEAMQGRFQMVAGVFGGLSSDRIARYGADAELLPGVTALPIYGHTPGQTGLQIASGDAVLLALADLSNVPQLFVRHPDWSVQFDMDADMARDTRHRVLDRAAADRAMVTGYHWGLPNAGHIRKLSDGGYELVPLPYRRG